jgi:hypothetical protein
MTVSLLLGCAVAFAKPPSPASTGLPGTLSLSSSTEGAEVYIDGERVGTIPLPGPLPLAAGEHTIKVVKAGYAPLIDVFKIQKKGQTKLEVELVPITGALKVTSSVEKARVFVDGKFACEAPCTAEMQVGARAIQVSKGGYKDFFQNIASVAGQEVALDVKLEELPVGLNPYKPAAPPPARWFEKWWVWTLAAVGAGVVVTAVVVPVTESQRDRIKEYGPLYDFSVNVPPPPR